MSRPAPLTVLQAEDVRVMLPNARTSKIFWIICNSFETTRQQTRVDANGYAREVMSNDIWAVSTNGKDLRRIIKNANHILIWLH